MVKSLLQFMPDKCEECGTKLVTLYYQERKNDKVKAHKIKEKYCRKCKKPMIVMNWFIDKKGK